MSRYILALDQGTTSSRAILFDRDQNIVGAAQRELTQIFPHAGWVEQNPVEIYSTQYAVMMEVLAAAGVSGKDVAAIGITNQRETTALGAAYLAGLAAGVWGSRDELLESWRCGQVFEPQMDATRRASLLAGWDKAVGRSLSWAE